MTFALAMMISAGFPGLALAQARDRPPGQLMAIALQDLRFGNVLPGIPETVSPIAFKGAGHFEIQGVVEGMVRIEFLLPDALISAYGATLPLEFGPSDGYADFSRGHPPRGLIFDPRTPLVAVLGPNGRLNVRLGGTVRPARDQAGGKYVAMIALTVYDLGS
jgi:hypothetical protein